MTPGKCSACGADAILHRLPQLRSPAWRAPVLLFGMTSQPVWVSPDFPVESLIDEPQENGLVLGLLVRDQVAELIACRPAVAEGEWLPKRSESEWACHDARLWHALSCAEAKRVLRPPGDEALCRGCGARVFWIVTEEGKKAPLDPTPHRGVKLSKQEAKEAVHTKGYVIGLDRHGRQARIREGGQMTLGAEISENVTVYVNHFATCPNRGDFASKKRGEQRA